MQPSNVGTYVERSTSVPAVTVILPTGIDNLYIGRMYYDNDTNSATGFVLAVSEKEFQLNSTDKGKVTISVGVATFPDNAETTQELIEHADKGLYYAKEHGRNQVVKIDTIEG